MGTRIELAKSFGFNLLAMFGYPEMETGSLARILKTNQRLDIIALHFV